MRRGFPLSGRIIRSTAALAAFARRICTPLRFRSVNTVFGYIGVREPLAGTASMLIRTCTPSGRLTVPPATMRTASDLSSMLRTRISTAPIGGICRCARAGGATIGQSSAAMAADRMVLLAIFMIDLSSLLEGPSGVPAGRVADLPPKIARRVPPALPSQTQLREGDRLRTHLFEGALPRPLFRTPAQELGSVAEAPAREVVVAHLADQRRPQRHPLGRAPLAPAAGSARRLAGETGRLAQRRQDRRQLAPLVRREAGGEADVI